MTALWHLIRFQFSSHNIFSSNEPMGVEICVSVFSLYLNKWMNEWMNESITTNNEFESRSWKGVLNTTLCDKCHWLEAGRWFSPDTPVSSTNKAEISLKVTSNTLITTIKVNEFSQLLPFFQWPCFLIIIMDDLGPCWYSNTIFYYINNSHD